MIVTTKRSGLRFWFDVLLTALGWIAFGALFVNGILAILRGEMHGPDAPFLSPELLALISTVSSYVLVTVGIMLLLILWAKYNQHRFSGVDRRKRAAPPSQERLCTSFGVSYTQFCDAQGADVMVVHHDEDGAIHTVEVLGQADTCALDSQPVQEKAAQTVQVDTVEQDCAVQNDIDQMLVATPQQEQQEIVQVQNAQLDVAQHVVKIKHVGQIVVKDVVQGTDTVSEIAHEAAQPQETVQVARAQVTQAYEDEEDVQIVWPYLAPKQGHRQ